MELEVLKFGGSSLASSEALLRVAEVLVARKQNKKIVVCSAMGGITGALLAAGQHASSGNLTYKVECEAIRSRHLEAIAGLGLPDVLKGDVVSEISGILEEIDGLCQGMALLGEFSDRSSDALVSCGERMAVPMVAALLTAAGLSVKRVDAREWICTDAQHGAASVDVLKTTAAIQTGASGEYDVLITEGFIGRGPDGATTTLGRGGSDYTASLIARAVDARFLEKSTDVQGMMTADPRMVPDAKIIPEMSYEEAMELCHFGAKVIYHPTIAPLQESGIPLIVRSTFARDNHPGTRIVQSPAESVTVRGLSSISEIALLTLVGGSIIGKPGFSRRVFTACAQARVNVVLITQSSSEHSITLAVSEADLPAAEAALHEEFDADLALGRLQGLRVDREMSIVALVGGGMAATTGVSGRAFEALGAAGVNVRAIAQGSTERNISIVVASAEVPAALRALHFAFFHPAMEQLNLVCLGVGQVGGTLLDQIHAATPHLLVRGIDIRVVALARSESHLLAVNGLDLSNWRDDLKSSGRRHTDPREVLEAVADLRLPNLVFVDNTASSAIAALGVQALSMGMHWVSSNKAAASGPLAEWNRALDTARSKGLRILYETNVGAALPIVQTIGSLRATGDSIHEIQAVLSGSLNFIFSKVGAGESFVDAVVEARSLGYTEPDPRMDLSGADVARKITILARLADAEVELTDVEIESFLPSHLFEGSAEDFMTSLPEADLSHLKHKDGVPRFVASFKEGRCAVGLQWLDPSHPLAQLQGTDNQVMIYSDRYPHSPLIIRGAGAGAALTAGGVFADILQLASHQP